MQRETTTIAPGANVLVRDEAWRVRKVERASNGQQVMHVTGISELVRDKEAIFVREFEEQFSRKIKVLAPEKTDLVSDSSSGYQASLLYMESLLRQMPPTDDELHIGHRAAMDVLDFQLKPALMALEKPRQRMLIADAVGLGKTLEAGILMSELIRRGRGKRILVVALKSMLTQFQKEMWTRFTIPLVRLDSIGLQRIRADIPTNQNPFYYYDKAIISIDTLKQNNEYRVHLENAHWDIIVIDEAHNVAARGTNSMRSQLAELLSHRSDTLLMLSATPHDGKAESFASLMNMLDPTAIANPTEYGPEDIEGLYVRRHKNKIRNQIQGTFPDREIYRGATQATEEEEAAFDELVDVQFGELDQRRTGNMLFKTSLEKALLSSPAACISTIDNRVKRLERDENDRYVSDIAKLNVLRNQVEGVAPDKFSKYQKLLSLLRDDEHFSFTGHFKTDRLVIFTERIDTMNFLADQLKKDLDLDDRKVKTLHGSMSDQDQQRIVEAFGQENADIRLLVASDFAAEGINLHYQCHRMIHFDIPWSLMTFQQRNGRIDRYGQEEVPRILYLYTESENEKLRGDTRILELLIQRDEQAAENIGDPSALQGVYDIDEQEEITAKAIEKGLSPEEFEAQEKARPVNKLERMLQMAQETTGPPEKRPSARTHDPVSLFPSDFRYVESALDLMRQEAELKFSVEDADRLIRLHMPDDLSDRFEFLPSEIEPDDGILVLTEDRDEIADAIKVARTEESAWPPVHYLWPLNPVVTWVNDRMMGNFGRHTAPVLTLHEGLEPDETIFITSGLIPNRKSQPLMHRWFGVVFKDGELAGVESFEETRARTKLGNADLVNRGDDIEIGRLEKLRTDAVTATSKRMGEVHADFRAELQPKLDEQLDRLGALEHRQLTHLNTEYEGKTTERDQNEKDAKRRQIGNTFEEFVDWVTDTLTTEDVPFIQIIAVLQGE